MSVVSFEISSTDDGASVLTITETLQRRRRGPSRGGQLPVGCCARCCCGRARSPSRSCGERARRSVLGAVRSDAPGAVRAPTRETGPTRRHDWRSTRRSRGRQSSSISRHWSMPASPTPSATGVRSGTRRRPSRWRPSWRGSPSRAADGTAARPAGCGVASACVRPTSVITCGDERPAGNGPDPRPRRRGTSLRNQHADAPLDDASAQRLADLEVSLDQCWDLLRQRRARRSAGLEPDEAEARPADTVEHYQQ